MFVTDIWQILPFGRHKGKTIREMLNLDPNYLLWLHKNTTRFTMCEKLVRRAIEATRSGCDCREIPFNSKPQKQNYDRKDTAQDVFESRYQGDMDGPYGAIF